MKGWHFDTFLPFFPNVLFFLETWKPVLHRLYRGGHQACAFLEWFGCTLKWWWVKPKPNVRMESPSQCQGGCVLFHPCNFGWMKYTIIKGGQPEIKGLLWVAVTEGTAACYPLVSGAAGIATRLCSFTGCLGWEAEAEWDASGLGFFDIPSLWQNAAAEWPWQMEVAADLKGSGKLKNDRVCGSFGSLAAPHLWGEGHLKSKERSVEAMMWIGTLEKTDMTSAMQQETSAAHSSPQVLQWNQQWLCTSCTLQMLRSPSALGVVLLQESLLKWHCISPRSQGAFPTHPDFSLVTYQEEAKACQESGMKLGLQQEPQLFVWQGSLPGFQGGISELTELQPLEQGYGDTCRVGTEESQACAIVLIAPGPNFLHQVLRMHRVYY